MAKQNVAQQIHQHLGMPISSGPKTAHGSKNASATKRGTGRYHAAEHRKASPIKDKGAPRGFVLHTASEEKQLRRKLIRMSGGIRQHKRQERNANMFAGDFAASTSSAA